jgi:dTDP-4-amino-4,6-dideoxygalactose transaminase
MEAPIPFNQTLLAGNEIPYVEEALKSGHVSASGPYSKKASAFLKEHFGAAEVFLTTSCTDALEMGALLLGLKPGDTVIIPSFTFVSTALAFLRCGVKILFADIERETLGLNPKHVAELLDDKVKAIIPVHYAGVACDMETLKSLTAGRGVDLFEDNAQGLFGTYQGKPLGSLGRLSATSFHETKNIVCGEGGALAVNRPEDVDRARILYDKGTNRQAFLLGAVDKYSWVDEGSSFGMSDVLAAYLMAQLEKGKEIQSRRKALWNLYQELLAPAASRLRFSLPLLPAGREHSYHMFYLLLENKAVRDRALKRLREHNIQATFLYTPLHSSAGARPHLLRPTECPVTDEISGRLLRLPLHNALMDDQVRRVVKTLLEVLEKS